VVITKLKPKETPISQDVVIRKVNPKKAPINKGSQIIFSKISPFTPINTLTRDLTYSTLDLYQFELVEHIVVPLKEYLFNSVKKGLV
jgi:hypothetical protein